MILVCAAVLIAFRLHASSIPLETDECNYAYIGRRLLQGDRLYIDVWDHQPPGVFCLFAAATVMFGQSDTVFRWMATAFSVVSLVLIFALLRRRYGLSAAVLGAVLFAITSSDPGTAGDGVNREIYMNTLALAAVAALARFGDAGRLKWVDRQRLFLAGLLLGIASVFKTVVAAQWGFLAMWVLSRAGRAATTHRVRSAWAGLIWFGLGPALIWAMVLCYFAATNRWTEFGDAVFAFNLGYSSRGSTWWARIPEFFSQRFRVFDSAMPMWWGAAAMVPVFAWLGLRRRGPADGLIVAYVVGSVSAVMLPGLYWPHYYYLLVPPMVLLCGAGASRLASWAPTVGIRNATYAVFAGWTGVVFLAQLTQYLMVDPVQVTAHRYDYREQWAHAQGLRVKEVTDPNDCVFVWGRDAGIYYYGDRRCASRYTMVGALLNGARDAARRREILLDEMRRNRPRLVLVVDPEFEALRAFLESNYLLAGIDRDDDDAELAIMIVWMNRRRPIDQIDWEWRAPG